MYYQLWFSKKKNLCLDCVVALKIYLRKVFLLLKFYFLLLTAVPKRPAPGSFSLPHILRLIT